MAGTYQSRVFNFINSQTNRVKNRLGQSWRQVKVSVQWTGQILLAPLRWLNWLIPAPESQIPGNNRSKLPLEQSEPVISTAIDHQTLAYTAKEANTKLENLLATFAQAGYGLQLSPTSVIIHEDWSVIDENEWDTTFLDESHRNLTGTAQSVTSQLPSSPVIRGLATLLSNRHLVLVDQHNQVLDVLSSSQQLHICQQISPIGHPVLPKGAEQLPSANTRSLSLVASIAEFAPPPTLPRTVFQKIGYWCKFYLEYFQVAESHTKEPGKSLALWSPSQKAIVVTPTAISVLSATENSVSKTPSQSFRNAAIDAAHPRLLTSSTESGTSKTINLQTTAAQSQTTFQPEWIEAPSQILGYEKTLLQQLWSWLDRLMLKIENWIISLYQRLIKSR